MLGSSLSAGQELIAAERAARSRDVRCRAGKTRLYVRLDTRGRPDPILVSSP